MSILRNRSFDAGRKARQNGKPFDACKSPNPKNNELWQIGWLYMDAQLPKPVQYQSYYLTPQENRVK